MSNRRQPLVTRGKWCVSTTSPAWPASRARNLPGRFLCVDRAIMLNVFIPRRDNPYLVQRGDGDGLLFLTQEEADKYCLEHGYLQVYVPNTWCRIHRVIHTFLGKRTNFCTKETCGVKHEIPWWREQQLLEKANQDVHLGGAR